MFSCIYCCIPFFAIFSRILQSFCFSLFITCSFTSSYGGCSLFSLSHSRKSVGKQIFTHSIIYLSINVQNENVGSSVMKPSLIVLDWCGIELLCCDFPCLLICTVFVILSREMLAIHKWAALLQHLYATNGASYAFAACKNAQRFGLY